MEQILRGVTGILEYEGMRRVHLIGISLGGTEAQCFMRAYPHLVQSLLLCQRRRLLTSIPGIFWRERTSGVSHHRRVLSC